MLNSQQLEAKKTLHGPLLILAGAGTGKTTALVNRIQEMIAQNIPARNILAITFTNKAAKELEERIVGKMGQSAIGVWASTFHSLCSRILRFESNELDKLTSNFTIYDTNDSVSVVKHIIKDLGFDIKEHKPVKFYRYISALKTEMVDFPTYYEGRPLNEFIDWEKANSTINETILPEDEDLFLKIYEHYHHRMLNFNAMDFDDIIMHTLNLFIEKPHILDKYQDRFRYIMCDEYQDTNRGQYVLLKLLAQKHRNIGVVGDDAQGIYKFRGADIRNILNFQRDYPDAKVIALTQNYRSTDVILEAANAVIAKNVNQYKKDLFTVRTDGELITFKSFYNEHQEAEYIALQIERLIARGKQLDDFAVLLRTNGQTRHFEQAFFNNRIPYKIIGGGGMFKSKEILDLTSYVKFIANNNDFAAFERIINYPKRGIGPKTLNTIRQAALNSSLTQVLNDLSSIKLTKKNQEALQEFNRFRNELTSMMKTDLPKDIVSTLIEQIGIIEEIEKSGEDKTKIKNRKENISQFINMAAELTDEDETKTFIDFVERVALYSDTEEADDDGCVRIFTVHASKGLEFPIVFGAGMSEGVFPHERNADDLEALEEERRLFYVLITRAMHKLYLTYPQSRYVYGKVIENESSRFFDEIPDYLYE